MVNMMHCLSNIFFIIQSVIYNTICIYSYCNFGITITLKVFDKIFHSLKIYRSICSGQHFNTVISLGIITDYLLIRSTNSTFIQHSICNIRFKIVNIKIKNSHVGKHSHSEKLITSLFPKFEKKRRLGCAIRLS